ncbi:MAG: leucine-rich repeat domain-containing protein [Clostridiales bacterium]|nr:leucine-rich repeat domain-containing protein [Clostridiales bacterium]
MKKKMIYWITSIFLALTAIGFAACKDDDKNTESNNVEQSQEIESSSGEHTHVWEESFSEALTCGKSIEKIYSCECGETKKEDVQLPEHSFIHYEFDNNPWCDENATETAVCDNEWCEVTDTREVPNTMTGHHGGARSCKSQAVCVQCQKPYGEIGTHRFTDYVYNNDATCEEDGTETAVCVYHSDVGCNETDTRRAFGTALGHSGLKGTCTERSLCERCGIEFGGYFHFFQNYVYNNDAKCEVDGTKTAICEYGCGTQNTVEQKGSALEHIFENYVSDNNATCETDATQTAICEREGCESTHTVSIEGTALGHTYGAYVSDESGKCEENGTESALCVNGCGEKLTREERWSHLGHNFVDGICTACEAKESIGLEYVFNEIGQYYSVAGIGTCTDSTLLIPATYNGYPVKEIADDSFNRGNLKQIVKVVLPNTVTYVGTNAFGVNDALTNVLLSKNLTELGAYAFWNCPALEKCPLPDSLTILHPDTFSFCKKLTAIEWSQNLTEIGDNAYSWSGVQNLVIPDTVTSIGVFAFTHCEELISVELPDTITRIEQSTFEECFNLQSVKLPSDLIAIGSWAFSKCVSLQTISFPESLLWIGDKAFMGCESLQTLTFPAKLQTISGEAFRECLSIERVVIPEGMAKLGQAAFYGCENLKKVVLPENFVMLNQAFIYCSNLEEINFPRMMKEISSGDFLGCEKIKDVQLPDSVTSVSAATFSETAWFNDKNNWTNGMLFSGKHLIAIDETVSGTFHIPDGVLTVADQLFTSSQVTEVYIPASVSNITSSAFWNCTKVEKITVADENVKYFSVDGNLYERLLLNDGTPIGTCTLVKFAPSNPMKTYMGIEGLTNIQSRAFSWSQYVEEVIFPDSVTRVQYYNFEECAALRKVEFSPNITSLEQMFYKCPNLEEIILPKKLTQLFYHFVAYCPKLTTLILPDSVMYIGENLANHCDALTTVVIGVNVKTVYTNMISSCPNVNVYYKGSVEDKALIQYQGDETFLGAWYCYSETPPTEEGDFWHYVNGEIVQWEFVPIS